MEGRLSVLPSFVACPKHRDQTQARTHRKQQEQMPNSYRRGSVRWPDPRRSAVLAVRRGGPCVFAFTLSPVSQPGLFGGLGRWRKLWEI